MTWFPFRHSVYFATREDAQRAEERIRWDILPHEIYQVEDAETGRFEVRFFTRRTLDSYEQTAVLRGARGACSYALNCDNW